jgi:hypothetical protein
MSAPAFEPSDHDRTRIVDAVVRDSAGLVAAHTDANGFAYELGTNLVTARG